MLARLDPRSLGRIWFPLGDQVKDETRAEAGARRPGGRGARREPGGLLPRRRRLPLVPRPARAGQRGRRDRRRGRAPSSARTTASGGSRPASAAASASRRPSRSMRCRPTRARTPSSPGRAPSLARTRVSARGPPVRAGRAGDAKLRYRSPACGATVEQTASGFGLRLDEPAYGVARGQAAVLYDGDVVVGSGLVTRRRRG